MTRAIDAPGSATARIGSLWRVRVGSWVHRSASGSPGATFVLVGLAVTLALLPFEGVLLRRIQPPGWRFTITDVEAAAALTIGAWAALLVHQRRWPALPRSLAVCVVALAGVTLASALNAATSRDLALQVAARALLGLGVLVLTVDLVRRAPAALALLLVLLTTVGASAAVGWIAARNGTMDGLFGAGRLFTVGGEARLAGTWDYPTIAAMAWSSVLLATLPLLALAGRGRRSRVARTVLAMVLAFLGASIVLTLTRGAFLGLGAGMLVLVCIGILLRSRRLVVVVLTSGLVVGLAAALFYARSPLPVERLLMESDRALYGARYEVPGRVAVASGGLVRLDITVHNTGLATWTPVGEHPWRLATVWLDPDTRDRRSPHQVVAVLPRPVAPGEAITLHVTQRAPQDAGIADLAWDMQQGAVADFSERDVPVALTRVEIDATAAGRPVPAVAPVLLRLYPDQLATLDRGHLWIAALRLVERSPWLGVGPGVFRMVYGAQLGLARWDTQIHANNLVLELAATTGLLGLAAFGSVVILALGAVLRGLRAEGAGGRDAPVTPAILIRAGSAAATAAALAHGMVDHFLVFMPMAVLFWVLSGIGVGLSAHAPSASRRPPATEGRT